MSTVITKELKLESQRLFQAYQATEDLKVRNQIIELNLGLVKKEARHWMNQCSESYEDLLQVGCLGLIRAIERFDLKKGYAFSSFAIPYIRGEIQHYLRDKGYSIRIPRRWLDLKRQANKIIQGLRNELNRQPTDLEIAQTLRISLSEWQEIQLAHKNREPLSLDITASDEDERTSLGDLVPDTHYRSFELAQGDKIRLHNALLQLEERTRQVLEFIFLQDLTQKQTAEALGVSVVTVSRQVKKGIDRMRNLITQEEFY
jgi:RNA polymerase sigma-B factor